MEGNERFAGDRLTSRPNRTLARLKALGEKQAPFASILGCADSRVPVEILFDQGFGDLFVCRAAGNIATSEIIGSLEYGTLVLGSKLLMVLGHTACGAVSATVKGEAVPGQISSLYPYIHPAAERVPSGNLKAIIEQNVRNQVGLLRNASPVIKELVRDGKLQVVGAVFDFHDGRVNLLHI
jgi:carbonic anhydrase